MNMVMNLVLALQILTALVMIGLVLIQHGKGADMGASFGSGASGSLFGATGSANFLSRSTAVLRRGVLRLHAGAGLLRRTTAPKADDRQRARSRRGQRAGAPRRRLGAAAIPRRGARRSPAAAPRAAASTPAGAARSDRSARPERLERIPQK